MTTGKHKSQRQNGVRQPVIEIGMPSILQIELVQGNDLHNYEIFFSLASLLFSTAIGFWTSYVSVENPSSSVFWCAISFSVLTVVSVLMAYSYRKKVFGEKIVKNIEMR